MKSGVCYVLLALGTAAFSGCDSRPDVATYSVPKDPKPADAAPASASGMQALPGMAESISGLHQPEWRAPAQWQALPLDNIRRGAWTVSGADGGATAEITVTVFPGSVGGLLLNVNRWRGQIGLPEISEAELGAYVERRVLGKENSEVVALTNDARGQTMITALVPHDGATWFFKIMGDATLIKEQSANWEAFLQSIHFAGH